MPVRPSVYPFSALVGQERMKRALMACAVCPSIGGVLVRGQKGTAKSTAVRALAALLPHIEVVRACPFSCDPRGPLCPDCASRVARGETLPTDWRPARLVDLPLGATEDRVTGSLDLEVAIRFGRKALEPGLLARAHRGILYVDEVNLLSDHLVDILLDAASLGVNIVEREGISFRHPAEVILVGTMNPEEGELRPQLLDRFGLCVEVAAPEDIDLRCEVLRRREAFDSDPSESLAQWIETERQTARALVEARRALPLVRMPAPLLAKASELCVEACVAGHRADLTLRRTARALAALAQREDVRQSDLDEAAELVLLHRRRMPPPPAPSEQQEEQKQEEHEHEHQNQPEQEQQPESQDGQQPQQQQAEARASEDEGELEQSPESSESDEADAENQGRPLALETIFPVGAAFRVKPIVYKKDRVVRTGSGRRTRSRTSQKSGRYVKARQNPAPTDLALDATLRAAAPHQRSRRELPQPGEMAVLVQRSDLRQRVREKRMGHFIIFVVDASGSMGAGQRMVETKGAVLSLLLDAYQKRDKVGLIAFRGQGASVLLPPTSSVDLAYRLLEDLPTGGKTPLVHGLSLGHELVLRQLRRDPTSFPVLVVISDGKANVSLAGGKPLAEARLAARAIAEDGRIRTLVVDVEKAGLIRFGLAQSLAAEMGAQYFRIEDLRARDLVDVLRREVLDGAE
ncbi:MAG: putative cobaltochelatase [Humidesulfovibrio sp.]